MAVLLGYTAEQVCRLTGLSPRQLRYWDNTGFFSPQYTDHEEHRPSSRIYSFRDVVALRAIALLRNEHHVPLSELREVGAWLARNYKDPRIDVKFCVAGQRVFFDDVETGAGVAGGRRGEAASAIGLQAIARQMEAEAERLRERQPDDIGKVRRYRRVMGGVPVIAGTRIPTSAIWHFREAGYDTEAIIRQYPTLQPEDVWAAIWEEEEHHRRRAG